jgi:hypothetical protein
VTAADLLADLTRQGFTLAREGEGIRVTPVSRLAAEQRRAVVAHKPALLALLAAPGGASGAFAWDQAEADRLLVRLRDVLARVEAAVAAGNAPAVRAAALRTWLDVAEGFVKDREREAARGWDALELVRAAVSRALALAGGEPDRRNVTDRSGGRVGGG